MTRIAFYLDTQKVPPLDLRDVDAGNPGIGGSEYMFFLIARHLARALEVHFYLTRAGRFPEGITYHEVADFREAAAQFNQNGERLVILRESETRKNAACLREARQQFLAWAHNYSSHKILRFCSRTAKIARYLCVSRDQYENLRDEAIFAKCDYVYNAAATGAYPQPDFDRPLGNDVVFMASIVPPKGFHILARAWQDIKAQVPDARLHIVGSGQLYDRDQVMGPLGIAAEPYERQFAPCITRNGRLREDVIFHGTLGADKNAVLGQAKVAVVNPTGFGETFCISAVEFELLGVPVVTKNLGGPKNVVQDGRTGILYERESQLAESVVRLLREPDLREAMARQAAAFARATFDVERIIQDWLRVIREVEQGRPAVPDLRITDRASRLLRAKEFNRRLKAVPGLGWLPSVDHGLHFFRKKTNSLFRKPWHRLAQCFR